MAGSLAGCVAHRRRHGTVARRRQQLYDRHVSLDLDLAPILSPAPRCGAAAAAMVTAFHDRPLSETSIFEALGRSATAGVSNRALAAHLRHHGFECYNIHGSMEDLLRLLRRRLPPMVLVRSLGGKGFHYLVVVGLASEAKLLKVNNPFCGREILSFDEFEKAWAVTEHSLLVVAPAKQQSPRTP